MTRRFYISRERAKTVTDEITLNSCPAWRFYALLITAAMIACFGLAANSTAVIIGAMLVSPLMTPIFGIALGMLQGDVVLMGKAARAEFGGVFLAVVSAALVGVSPLFAGDATQEMLSRTQPNLIDLLVAVFAGFAGAYALVDERISPALPGVAIATAIVPPLSTCGLCISLEAWSAAGGAMLLFLANFVSILIVALIVFGAAGLTRTTEVKTWRAWGRRFAPAAIVFIIVVCVLTESLIQIISSKRVERGIHDRLTAEFATDQAVDLDDFLYNIADTGVEVLANVRAPRVIMPSRVTKLQEAIAQEIGRPVNLVVRTTLARDVSPLGSTLQVSQPDISGAFLTKRSEGSGSKELLAAQVVREFFEASSGFELTNIEYGVGRWGRGTVLAYVDALTSPSRETILEIEKRLRERLGDDGLTFAVRINEARIESSHGPYLPDWADWRQATRSEYAALAKHETLVKETVAKLVDATPRNVHFRFGDKTLEVLVEIVGRKAVTKDDVKRVEEALGDALGRPVAMSFWYRNEYVVDAGGYTTFEQACGPEHTNRQQALQDIFGARPGSVSEADQH